MVVVVLALFLVTERRFFSFQNFWTETPLQPPSYGHRHLLLSRDKKRRLPTYRLTHSQQATLPPSYRLSNDNSRYHS